MANMELITSVTVGSGGAASVTLPATGTIPATYTDLYLLATVRSEVSGDTVFRIRFNSDSGTNYKWIRLLGDGTSTSSQNQGTYGAGYNTSLFAQQTVSTNTANTFGNSQIYIPNYAGSNYKSVSIDSVTENNATAATAALWAGLWESASAINAITLSSEGANDLAEGSTFYLYGISNVTSTTKATGGIVSSDGTYNYHMFPFSGTFTPTEAISADVLCIAGGGSGGSQYAGGGGAGGLVEYTSQSLTATGYPVVIGAGGAAATGGNGATGGNTTFNGNTISGGGGGSWWNSTSNNGQAGGGGGSMGTNNGDSTTGGAALAGGQGSAGGGGYRGSGYFVGGGGGGKGAAGTSATSLIVGTGGIGASYSTWASATSTGDSGYYAGGGGGSVEGGSVALGGSGGGGRGALFGITTLGTAGLANTGGGGGGAVQSIYASGAGGSGLVIIRYAI